MKPLALAVIVLSCAAVLSACGASAQDKAPTAQDKAQTQVCNARSDINTKIDSLKTLTISSSTPSDVKSTLSSIKSDLSKIKDAQPDLSGDRKQQVQAATQTFTSQLRQIATSTVSGLSTANAKTQVQTAATSLASAYKQALAPISC